MTCTFEVYSYHLFAFFLVFTQDHCSLDQAGVETSNSEPGLVPAKYLAAEKHLLSFPRDYENEQTTIHYNYLLRSGDHRPSVEYRLATRSFVRRGAAESGVGLLLVCYDLYDLVLICSVDVYKTFVDESDRTSPAYKIGIRALRRNTGALAVKSKLSFPVLQSKTPKELNTRSLYTGQAGK